MFPWMRDQIEAWHNRKSARTADKRSLGLSSVSTGNSENRNMIMDLPSSSPEGFPINIISIEGNILDVTVKPNFTIENLKKIAVMHFYGQEVNKSSSCYSLVHSSKCRRLVDSNYIDDEEINEYDELLLVENRAQIQENLSDESLKGPSRDAIARATSNLPSRSTSKPMPPTECPADFQDEIRKILITLSRASARILMHSQHAENLYDVIKGRLEDKYRLTHDPKLVKTLMDMGYPQKKVVKALRLRKLRIIDALEWLIEHQDDPDDQDSETDLTMDTTTDASAADPGSSSPRIKWLYDECDELFLDSGNPKEKNLIYIVELMLECFRQYKKMEFKPNKKALWSLVDMGFEEKKVVVALKITGNDQANACAWLLGERRRSLQDLDEGLDPEGPIYKAIMSNPLIQLSLTNPRMLLACLSMIDIPAITTVWASDPEISPVLNQITKTYHAEKHALHMNRYSTSI
ncbi:ubiquitin-associated domain-containing protein 1 isoform X2 [Pseudomyrmex gracilis]|uniref:ubiquitin-associated domain-containing protein 1 isoform X2 n=1 Tax=Pseudomyrmex gracilis TaxID=219809 RepID=UPI000994ADA3|nr:ubiquitin-associated domain-containing protein 1 isoform X2 [Pseudomyrmex gracilis]